MKKYWFLFSLLVGGFVFAGIMTQNFPSPTPTSFAEEGTSCTDFPISDISSLQTKAKGQTISSEELNTLICGLNTFSKNLSKRCPEGYFFGGFDNGQITCVDNIGASVSHSPSGTSDFSEMTIFDKGGNVDENNVNGIISRLQNFDNRFKKTCPTGSFIRGFNNSGSPNCVTLEGEVIIDFPDAPTLSATPETDSVELSWTISSDGGDAITGYVLQFSLDRTNWENPPLVNEENVTGFTHSGLDSGTAYFYRVQAINGEGASDWSNTIEATLVTPVEPISAPDKMEPPVATPGDEKITLTWEKPKTNGSTIEKYLIERYKNGSKDNSEWINSPNTDHVFEGLVNGARYKFNILARSTTGENGERSDFSNEVTPFADIRDCGGSVGTDCEVYDSATYSYTGTSYDWEYATTGTSRPCEYGIPDPESRTWNCPDLPDPDAYQRVESGGYQQTADWEFSGGECSQLSWTPTRDNTYDPTGETDCSFSCTSGYEWRTDKGECEKKFTPTECKSPDGWDRNNRTMCPGDSGGNAGEVNKSLVESCSSPAQAPYCEYTCNEGYHKEGDRCVADETYSWDHVDCGECEESMMTHDIGWKVAYGGDIENLLALPNGWSTRCAGKKQCTVVCKKDSSGETVSDSYCNAASKPDEMKDCLHTCYIGSAFPNGVFNHCAYWYPMIRYSASGIQYCKIYKDGSFIRKDTASDNSIATALTDLSLGEYQISCYTTGNRWQSMSVYNNNGDRNCTGILSDDQCLGEIPANSQMCSGDGAAPLPKTLVSSCTTERKCEYTCRSGYRYSSDRCVHTYSWTAGAWGSCRDTHGGSSGYVAYEEDLSNLWGFTQMCEGTRTREVWCKRDSDSRKVSDSYCSGAGTKLDTSTNCQYACSGLER
jgi:hypothetical protein